MRGHGFDRHLVLVALFSLEGSAQCAQVETPAQEKEELQEETISAWPRTKICCVLLLQRSRETYSEFAYLARYFFIFSFFTVLSLVM